MVEYSKIVLQTDDKKKKDMMLLLWVVTFFISMCYGQQNAEFTYLENCYSVGNNLIVEAVYTGSGIPTSVRWSYSGEAGTDLIIVASTCTVFGSVPSGFPSSARMSYMCPATHPSLPANTYRLTVTKLQSEEFDYSWGATFSPPSGSAPVAVQVPTTKCSNPYKCPGLGEHKATDTEAKCGCAWFGIVCAILLCLFIIGIIVEYFKEIWDDDEIPFFLWILLFIIIVGFGILALAKIRNRGSCHK